MATTHTLAHHQVNLPAVLELAVQQHDLLDELDRQTTARAAETLTQ